jgi:hypothetical protein
MQMCGFCDIDDKLPEVVVKAKKETTKGAPNPPVHMYSS